MAIENEEQRRRKEEKKNENTSLHWRLAAIENEEERRRRKEGRKKQQRDYKSNTNYSIQITSKTQINTNHNRITLIILAHTPIPPFQVLLTVGLLPPFHLTVG